MAIVNSLVCWGGLTGKVVSISASTDVVTLANHGLPNGKKLWPSGTLPAELSVLVPVYARSTAAGTFTLHASEAGAIANTGQLVFAGASTYAAVTLKSDILGSPATALAPYGLSDLTRWGSRIYDGIGSWNAGRSGASIDDDEICELGEAFTETIPYSGNTGDYTTRVNVPCRRTTIVSMINGIRTAAFHYGLLFSGYQVKHGYGALTATKYDTRFDGFTVIGSGSGGGVAQGPQGLTSYAMIAIGSGRTSSGFLISVSNNAVNCLAVGWAKGFDFNAYATFVTVIGNMATKNTTGFVGYSGYENTASGFYYNNISVGNDTTDWGAATPTFDGASGNAGSGTSAWKSAVGTRITIATSDLLAWGTSTVSASDRYSPAAASSPQVDTAIAASGAPTLDIAGNIKPSYKGGAATYPDVGPYEYDHGYGPWPVTATLTLTGLVSGSDVVVLVAGTSTILTSVDANAGSSWVYTYSTVQNVDIGIIKPGYKVKYIRNYPLAASDISIPVEQQLDPSYS